MSCWVRKPVITIEGKFLEGGPTTQVVVEDGIVCAMETARERFGAADFADCLILPPLFDPQVNGGLGVSFTSPLEPERYDQVLQECWRRGISHILPTIITTDAGNLTRCLRALRVWRDGNIDVARAVPGFHLEGPGINPEEGFRGAHPQNGVRAWTEQEYRQVQEAAGGMVRKVTLAPETLGDLGVVRSMVRDGVLVSMGHTNAYAEQISRAVDAGVSLFTHWGNGISRKIDRHHNPLWPALVEDKLNLSLIADGLHLPVAMLQTAYLCKGPEKLVLTADTSPLAGFNPGVYDLWGSRVVVDENQKLTVVGTDYLAGSGSWLDKCFQTAFHLTGKAIGACSQMASGNIRRLLDLPPWELSPGKPAELTLVSPHRPELLLGCFGSGQFVPYLHDIDKRTDQGATRY
ncbi:MAG: N-acetylglucosamine-6-phosphate deacetylase [Gemmataceae bacterium]